MLIDRLRQISKSYTVYVPSTYTDIFGTGTYGTGNLDRNLAANNLNEVLEGTTWLDVATNGFQSSNIDATIAIKNDGTLWSWGYSDGTRPMTAGTINKSSPSQVGSDTDWRNVYGGTNDGSFFAIKTNNTLWAWGRNAIGILGNNNTSSQASPVLIGTAYSSASIGSSHTMAIRTDGTLWGWGLNTDGELGNGEARSLLKKIDNGFDWQQVSCGESYTMAIKTDGTLWGWGTNIIGRLGDNSTTNRNSPVQVAGGGNWKTVSANRSTTMAIKTNGSMWGWGEGVSFRMGTGVATDRSSPVQVGADTDWDIVSIGIEFGHAIKTTGTLWAWGLNTSGQLGDNTRTIRSVPTQIGVDTNWKDVHQGINFTIGLKTDGTLWSWGTDTSSYGVLGNGVAGSATSTPTQIGIDTDWDFISSGDYNCSAIKTDGTLWSWGYNNRGQLGDNTVANRSVPTQIGTNSDWLKVSCGQAPAFASNNSSTFAIKTDGTLWSWGNNGTGQLVQGTITNIHKNSPVLIGYLPYSWSSVSIGGSQVMAITDTNELYANPIDRIEVIGLTPNKSSPNQVGSDTNWKYVFGGNRVTYATKTDNTLWHWGFDIMTRSNDLIISPTQIGTDSNWKSLAVCYTIDSESVIATKTNGTLWAWGNNVYGQLGDNSTVAKTSPVQIGSDTDWDDVFNFNLGGATSLAIKTNGTLWIWGATNTYDFLLDILQQFSRSSPVQLRNGQWKKFAKNGATTLAGISINDTLHTAGNQSFNLGNSPFRITSPKQIGETLTNIKSISSHQDTGFYIKSNGTLWGWGLNSSGQIGNNNKATEPTPVQIGGDTDWLKVDAGPAHTMAIKTNGSLWGWGSNTSGRLGDDTTTSKSSPIQVGVGVDWSEVFTGGGHTLAIKTNGTLWGWGLNSSGQLGDGTTTSKSVPTQIGTDTNWSKISLGSISSLAVKTNGTLWGWGGNSGGQLGDDTTNVKSSPVQIGTDTDWDSVVASSTSSFARKTDGTLWVWGVYSAGNLGTHYLRRKFFKVPKPFSATMISTSINTSGGGTALIIDNNSRLWSWGLGTSYQLGDITNTSKNEAVLADANSVWSKISSGYTHSMGIKTTGTLWGWGSGGNGRLGLNNTATQTSPVQVGVDNDWLEISIRNANSYAIKTTGTLWGWGLGTSGQVGDNNVITRSTPAQIGVDTDWSKISAGDGYCMAIKTTGTLWGWGVNTNGRIGDNSTTNRSAPAQIGVDTDWSIVSSGLLHTMAIKTNGTLWGWGLNSSGQLGDNTTVNRSVPTQIGTDTNWSKVSAGSTHTLAVRTNGTLWAWGINTNYQMGIDTLTTVDVRSSPVQVGSDSDWSDVFAGLSYSIAVKSNGSIYSTGDGNVLGTGYSGVISRSSPVQLGFDSDWGDLPSKIFTNQTIVKKTNGTLWGWGLNTGGQLGDNTISSISSPIQLSSQTDFDQIFCINLASIFTRSQTL